MQTNITSLHYQLSTNPVKDPNIRTGFSMWHANFYLHWSKHSTPPTQHPIKNSPHKSKTSFMLQMSGQSIGANRQHIKPHCNNRYVDEANNASMYELFSRHQSVFADRLVSCQPYRSSNDSGRPQGSSPVTASCVSLWDNTT